MSLYLLIIYFYSSIGVKKADLLEKDQLLGNTDRIEKFCLSIADDELSKVMYSSIKGSGAFRRFKDNIHRYGIAEDWYTYRDNALKQIAIEWCKENGLDYKDN